MARRLRTSIILAGMGDRGNVRVLQHSFKDAGVANEIYLYTHWGGSYVAHSVQCALRRGHDRWDDEPYLTRIIFNEMTAGAELDTTSFGISTYMNDNEHEIATVDTETQTVSFAEPDAAPRVSYSFSQFASLDLVGAGLVPEPTACAADLGAAPPAERPAMAPGLLAISGWCAFFVVAGLWIFFATRRS